MNILLILNGDIINYINLIKYKDYKLLFYKYNNNINDLINFYNKNKCIFLIIVNNLEIYNYKVINYLCENNINFYFDTNILKLNKSYILKKKILNYLKINTLDVSNYSNIKGNLIIESIDFEFPLILKHKDYILSKFNSCRQLEINYNKIQYFSKLFYNNDIFYLEKNFKNCINIKIDFIFKNGLIIINTFDILFKYLKFNLILATPSNYFITYKVEILKIIDKLVKYFKITNFMSIEFLLDIDNKKIFFYNLYPTLSSLNYLKFYQEKYNIDLLELIINKDYKINKIETDKKYIIINKLNKLFINYYEKKKDLLFINNTISFNYDKSIQEIINICEYEYLKKLKIKNIIKINRTNYLNLYKDQDYYFVLKNYNNKNIFIKNKNNKPLDNLNFKFANLIIGNSFDKNTIELVDNYLEIRFFVNTFICITGSFKNIRITNNIYDKNEIKNMYEIIKINNGDILKLNDTKLTKGRVTYISFKNGIKFKNDVFLKKIYLENISDINNPINFNKKYIPYFNENFILKSIIGPEDDNNKLLDFIVNKDIIVGNKYKKIGFYLKFKITNKIKINYSEKYFKYPKGSIILFNNKLLLITSDNFKYIKGYGLLTIISTNLWKLSHLKKNDKFKIITVSLDHAKYKQQVYKNIFNKCNLNGIKRIKINFNKKKYKPLLFNYIDKTNSMKIKCKLLGDKYLIIEYKKYYDIDDEKFIEYAFRINMIIKKIKENIIHENIIIGINFLIIEYSTNIDKLLINLLKNEQEVEFINKCKQSKIKLPLLLNKNIINNKDYFKNLLKINKIKSFSELCKKINNINFIVNDLNYSNKNMISLKSINPLKQIIIFENTNTNKVINGSVSIQNFFCNIYYSDNLIKGEILGHTLPLLNTINYFDRISFYIVDNKTYHNLVLKNKNNLLELTKYDEKFDIIKFRMFYNNNKEKIKKIITFNNKIKNYYYNKEIIIDNYKNILSNNTGIIHTIFVNEGDKINIGDKLLIIKGINDKFLIKSNSYGKIYKIAIKKNQTININDLLIKIII